MAVARNATVTAKIDADATGLERGVARAKTSLSGLESHARRTHASLTSLAAGAVAVGAAGAGMYKFATDAMKAFTDVSGQTLKLQRTLGGSAEQASGLRAQLKMTGVDADAASRGFTMFERKVQAGGKELAAYGIATTDATGKTKDMYQLLPEVANLFQKMPNGIEKTALAASLFGAKTGTVLIPFLNKGAAGLAELSAQAQKAGVIMSDADVKGLAKYNLATRRVTEAIEGMKVSMGRNLMPTMTRLKTSFADMLPGLTTALAPAFVALGNAAATALDGIGANMPQIESFAKSFGVEIEQIAKSFQANWPEIKETISTIGTGLQRAGQFASVLWSAFTSLPPEVQSTLAMLAVLQKTGAIQVAFKGFDMASQLLAKVTGMSVQAGVVNVNGGVGGGAGKAAAATAGGAASKSLLGMGSFLGMPAALSVPAAILAGGWGFDRLVRAGENRQATGGNPATAGGMYGAMGGAGGTAGTPQGIDKLSTAMTKYKAVVDDSNKSLADRRAALQQETTAMATYEGAMVKSGRSESDVKAAREAHVSTIRAQAAALGLDKAQTDALVASLTAVPPTVTTEIIAINSASGVILQVANDLSVMFNALNPSQSNGWGFGGSIATGSGGFTTGSGRRSVAAPSISGVGAIPAGGGLGQAYIEEQGPIPLRDRTGSIVVQIDGEQVAANVTSRVAKQFPVQSRATAWNPYLGAGV